MLVNNLHKDGSILFITGPTTKDSTPTQRAHAIFRQDILPNLTLTLAEEQSRNPIRVNQLNLATLQSNQDPITEFEHEAWVDSVARAILLSTIEPVTDRELSSKSKRFGSWKTGKIYRPAPGDFEEVKKKNLRTWLNQIYRSLPFTAVILMASILMFIRAIELLQGNSLPTDQSSFKIF